MVILHGRSRYWCGRPGRHLRAVLLTAVLVPVALLLPQVPLHGVQAAPAAQVPGDPAAAGTFPVRFQGVAFTLDPDLAPYVKWRVVPAVAPQLAPSLGGGAPQHVQFAFVAGPDRPTPDILDPHAAQLRVFPVAGLRALDPGVDAGVDALRALLDARPAAPEGQLPVFPPPSASQAIRAQVRYLDFPGGSGVRFVTAYQQDVSPITNQRLLYTFQGLTADGRAYVSLVWPVSAHALPSTYEEALGGQSYSAFSEQFEAYLAHTTQLVNDSPAGAFTPDLVRLDGLLRTLTIALASPGGQ
ncbi:MAG TPA: hypothetical protein VHS99_03890 [Chloroflexota bacterium]|nr:hypothetical protein [Chloroflexota bacterium]